MVRFILALVMLFSFSFPTIAVSDVVDRIVFYVDNQAVTLRDFRKFSTEIREKVKDITNQEIVELLVNRVLLLKSARELFRDGSDDEIINNFVDFRIRSKIVITDGQIREFFEKNKAKFDGKDYRSVREQIEKYLFEREVNNRLRELIEELRRNSEVKVLFIP